MAETFDTSEVLTDEDYKLIENIKTLKRNLFSFIKMETFIEAVVKIVDESELVSFKNERVKKFIDKKRPVFILTVDRDKAINKFGKKFNGEEDEAKFFSGIIFDEVISNVTTYLKQSIDDLSKEDKDKIFDVNLFDEENYENNMLSESINRLSVISTLYGLRLENNAKHNIILELLI